MLLCYTHFANPSFRRKDKTYCMTLCEELYFEITLSGAKSDVKKFISFMKSGGLEDFFEFHNEYISYDDDYESATADKEVSVTLTNEDYGIEIDEFDTDEFLDIFCRASSALYVKGHLYDIDDEEFSFTSEAGDSYYVNSKKAIKFNEDEYLKDEEE